MATDIEWDQEAIEEDDWEYVDPYTDPFYSENDW